MYRLCVGATVACIIIVSSLFLVPFANADWTMFQSDTSNSGVGTGNPVLTPTLLWNYTAPKIAVSINPGTGESEMSEPPFESPAVANGIVYIGSADGDIYAFNATSASGLRFRCNSDDMLIVVVRQIVYIFILPESLVEGDGGLCTYGRG